MGLVLVPGDGTEMHRSSAAIGTVLSQNPADAVYRGVDWEVDSAVSGIIDGDESRRLNDSILKGLHGLLVLVLPDKEGIFASEVDERACDCRISLDPNAHVPGKTKESADISKGLAVGPVTYLGDFGVVGDMALVVALVPKDNDFGDCDEQLQGGNSGAGAVEAMEDAVDVIEVLPHKPAHLIVVGDRFKSAIVSLVASCRPLDATIVHKGPSNVGDLGLQNEGDIFIKYCAGIGPSLRQAGQSNCAYGGLYSS
jgi:hypothetical protein